MRKRVTLAALVVAGTFVAAPAARATFATTYFGLDGQQRVRLWETGPAQHVTVDPSIAGNPALTGDEPGAQRIDVYDSADSFDAAVPPTAPGCWTPSAHHSQCFGDPQQQAEWHTSTCNFPPGCDWPGASGLLVSVDAHLAGTDVTYRDTADGVPVDENITVTGAGGHRTVTLTSARFVRYDDSAGGTDDVRVDLDPHTVLPEMSENDSVISTGPGDDSVSANDGAYQGIACGDGNDTVVAGPEDTVNADCENVTVG